MNCCNPDSILLEEIVDTIAVGINPRVNLLERSVGRLNYRSGRPEVVLLWTIADDLRRASGAIHAQL